MKPIKESVGWCSPGDLRRLARVASQVVMSRVVPDGNGRVRLRFTLPPGSVYNGMRPSRAR